MSERSPWVASVAAACERVLIAIASVALRRSSRGLALKEAVERVFTFNCLGVVISPLQYREELLALLEIVEERRPRTAVEIGTFAGGTLSLLARCAAPDAIVISIESSGRRVRRRVRRVQGPPLPIVRGARPASRAGSCGLASSRDEDRVRRLLRSRSIELLFIDGDHTLEGVRRDLELYGPLLAEDGLVAFHDIVPGPQAAVGGVPQFWSELRAGRQVRELVRDWAQGEAGIGLVEAPELGDVVGFPTPPARAPGLGS